MGDSFRKELLKIEKDTGKVPVVRVSDGATGAILPASVLPALFGKIPAEGELSGTYETLGEAFSAMFAEYFSERAEEYYALAASEGYTGTPEEYAEGVLSGITPEYGPGRGEMYFDFYGEYSSDFPLSEGGRCAVSEKGAKRNTFSRLRDFIRTKRDFPSCSPRNSMKKSIGRSGACTIFWPRERRSGKGPRSVIWAEKRSGFSLFNYVKEELDSQAELFGSIAKGAAVLSGIFGVFAVLLYVNFMMQSVRDRYSSVAVCGRWGAAAAASSGFCP